MYVGVWLKQIKAPGYEFNPGDMYLVSPEMRFKFQESFKKNNIENAIKYAELNHVFEQYKFDNANTVMIVRTGGIGDIVALSSICEYLTGKNIIFITSEAMKPVFNWYSNQRVRVVSFNEPVFSGGLTDLMLRSGTIKRMYCDGIIENGETDNWYKVFFDNIGVNSSTDWWRPSMRTIRTTQKPSNISKEKKSILICPRASANMRSMSFETLYDAVKPLFPDANIYVHSGNVTEEEITWIADSNVKVIKALDVKEFLLDVYDADLVVSVDTGALHFREGICKPAVGLYSSFNTYSRTVGYKFTKSYDIVSRCDLQPCFIHQTEWDQVCEKSKIGSKVAPCLDRKINKTLVDQITEALKDFAL